MIFRNFGNFGNFGNVGGFPRISGNFRKFPGISGDSRESQISGNRSFGAVVATNVVVALEAIGVLLARSTRIIVASKVAICLGMRGIRR